MHLKLSECYIKDMRYRTHADDISLIRKLFSKSLNAVPSSDWPELIVKQWLQFEREEGDLQTMDSAQLK